MNAEHGEENVQVKAHAYVHSGGHRGGRLWLPSFRDAVRH